MDRAEAEVIFERGREVVVAVLLRMDEQIRCLQVRVARQEERISQLERSLNRSSRNSSAPPSSDAPGKEQKRTKHRSPRKQGAQEGHEGHGRELLPLSAVDEVIEHWPERCRCGHLFAEDELIGQGQSARHQLEELPEICAKVIEHCCPRVRCPDCGRRARAELPEDVASSHFGPRLQAAIATLSVRNRISRRDAAELGEELFGARLCTGSVDAIIERSSQALERPYEDLHRALRAGESLNMDETGWRTAGERRALWGMFSQEHALFSVEPARHEDHAKRLLGDSQAIVTSDRWWAYAHLPLHRRQVCWSHLRRDFQAHAEGLAAEKEFGEMGLELCERVFCAWKSFQSTGERGELERMINSLQSQFQPIIASFAAKRARNKRCRGMARNLLKAWPALWTFASHQRVQPTNNHAERSLRGAVIYRKLSLGSQSHGGERRIERLLSASITCRLQGRSLFAYMVEALTAHARGEPAPLLT